MIVRKHYIGWVGLFSLLLCSGPQVLQAHFGEGPRLEVWDMTADADLVFMGKVTDIQYRNSDTVPLLGPTGGPVYDEEGNQVFESSSDVPHTFVTFELMDIFRGAVAQPFPGGPPADSLTLKFLGGLSTNPNQPDTVAIISTFPQFDIGDVDVLFVQLSLNGQPKACPLVHCELGRLRSMFDPQFPTAPPMMYDENGFEIVQLNPTETLRLQNIALGPPHTIPDTLSVMIGTNVLTKEVDPEVNDFSDPNNFNPDDPAPEPSISLGPHFSEANFMQFMHDVSNALPPPSALPVPSADLSQGFRMDPVDDDGPVITALEPGELVEPDRPWLDQLTPEEVTAILAAEELERQMSESSGGDPVLPTTPCEQQIAAEGGIISDICGPNGVPDCRVDLFDFECLHRFWLECNDPDDPLCVL